MQRYTKLFISGVLLVVLSVQNDMFKEFIYQWEMDQKYKITEINEMYAGAPTSYQFGSTSIETFHITKDEPPFRDPWDNIINLADVYITIDGENKEVLKNFPVQMDEGLNQYSHYVSYWLVHNKKTTEDSFAVVVQMKRGIMRDMNGFIPNEEQKYRIFTISEKGIVKTEDFTYKTKSKLQTKLIPPMKQGPAGYYSDDWSAYPTIFTLIYPLFYPIVTFFIGTILIIASLVLFYRNKNKTEYNS
ncbi:hypothetical protein [Fictibacillus sp. 26RED30]|uniref:hypothetical protein n=1 Tax=Fictibacillus sp. 26RED30 TaxID=2745877 RepID=UPI0018CDAD93|nr:hypothetical protein [Fictibacillus sp. 26RED30]MBH0161839.1 hypothetical protein [Fictibacillus sp. 26RED30]